MKQSVDLGFVEFMLVIIAINSCDGCDCHSRDARLEAIERETSRTADEVVEVRKLLGKHSP